MQNGKLAEFVLGVWVAFVRVVVVWGYCEACL